jgi:hypothetical protein
MINPITHAMTITCGLLVIFGQVGARAQDESASKQATPAGRARWESTAENLPPAFGAEIKRVDESHRSIRTGQSVSRWQFDAIRSRYELILKRANGDQAVEAAVRARLGRLARDERSAEAARTIESILAQSHRRDQEVAAEERKVADAARSHARAFSARGYVQASTAMIEGRKLYILIANDGSTIAYLDVPPGLDIDRLVSHRIGVRGEPHFNEDLGARLITVRDVEQLGR